MDEYKCESQEIDLEDLRNSVNVYLKRFPDAVYFGECIKQKNRLLRHGKGVMKYQNGRVYEGEWDKDQRHGRGFEKYPNKNIYIGEFKEGKAHGSGKYEWVQQGEVYDGEWSKGTRHGYGVWKRKNGDSYIGEWKRGKADGYGVH